MYCSYQQIDLLNKVFVNIEFNHMRNEKRINNYEIKLTNNKIHYTIIFSMLIIILYISIKLSFHFIALTKYTFKKTINFLNLIINFLFYL